MRGTVQILRPEDLPGRGRLGNYEIVGLLGRGGMGTVYEARSELGRKVAIKVLLEQYLESDDLIERFLREARFAASIRHPRIVDVFDVGWSEDGQCPWFAMELLEGQNLDQFLAARKRPVEIDLAIRIVVQVLDALEAAHERSVVHRDLKPGNIFLTRPAPDAEIKVLDFGISKVLDEARVLTQAGQILGTPAYMSPEQARGGAVDHRADLYAAGSILYELLGGAPPFRGTPIAILDRKTSEDPPPLASLRADVPQRLLVAVARAMHRSPARRYGSAAEMRAALQAATTRIVVQAPADLLGRARLDQPTPIAWEVNEQTEKLPAVETPPLGFSDFSSYEPTRRSKPWSEPPPAPEPGETLVGRPRASLIWAAALGGLLAGALALAGATLLEDAGSRPSAPAASAVSLPPLPRRAECRIRAIVTDPTGALELAGNDMGRRIDMPAPCGSRHRVRATAVGRQPRELELEAADPMFEPLRIDLPPLVDL